jgi:hypothetical protein
MYTGLRLHLLKCVSHVTRANRENESRVQKKSSEMGLSNSVIYSAGGCPRNNALKTFPTKYKAKVYTKTTAYLHPCKFHSSCVLFCF